MEDLEICLTLADLAKTESVEIALSVAGDMGLTLDEALFNLEFMGVIR